MRKILYIFDDVNYKNGVQKVTFYQIEELIKYYEVSVFSLCRPEDELKRKNFYLKWVGERIWDKTEIFSKSLTDILQSDKYSWKQKGMRIFYGVLRRWKRKSVFLDNILEEEKEEFESYDVIIVVSEASKMREFISTLKKVKKIQWIHTNYGLWSEFSDWTREITKDDKNIYSNYDVIVTLSESNKKAFLEKIPELEKKVVVIPNMISVKEITEKAEEICSIEIKKEVLSFVTVGRLEKEKGIDRLLNICTRLKKKKDFIWYIIGTGTLEKHIKEKIEQEDLKENVILLGELENPYPVIKQCDIFALLSYYEGTPVTIEEAMILNKYIIVTDIGGIKEQVKNYKKVQFVKNDIESIEFGLTELLKKNKDIWKAQSSYIDKKEENIQKLIKLF